MERISSRANEKIKYACSLKQAHSRAENGDFLIEGYRLVKDAVLSGIDVRRIFFDERAKQKYSCEFLGLKDTEIFEISEPVCRKLEDTKNSQGVFAVCKVPEREFVIDSQANYVLLENLQNPANMGTILRTAEALGVSGAVLVNCPDIYSPKALRSGMGCTFRLPCLVCEDLSVVEQFKACGISVYAAVVKQADTAIDELSGRRSALVAIGNEGNGLSEEFLSLADKKVTIPMKGRAESLNAASAASIIIYEMMK